MKNSLFYIFSAFILLVLGVFIGIKFEARTRRPNHALNETIENLQKTRQRKAPIRSQRRGKTSSMTLESDGTSAAVNKRNAKYKQIVQPVISQLIAEKDSIQKELGPGTISGKVSTSGGHPLSQVKVTATRINRMRRDFFKKNRTGNQQEVLQNQLDDFIDNCRLEFNNIYETYSDQNGSYSLENLPDDSYWLQAHAKGYEIKANIRNYYSVPIESTVDFIATQAVKLPVEVQDWDGKLLATAYIKAVNLADGSRTSHLWNKDNPEFKLAVGTYELQATNIKRSHAKSKPQKVILEPGIPPEKVVLKFENTPGVYGKVIFPSGIKMTHLTVYLVMVNNSKKPTQGALLKGKSCWSSPHKNYKFNFENIVPGNYRLGTVTDKTVTSDIITVTDKKVQKDLVLPPFDPSNYVIVRVLNPEGQIMKNCYINLTILDANRKIISSGRSSSRRNITLPDGSYGILHPSANLKKSPQYFVFNVHSSDFGGALSKEIEAPLPSEVTIQCEAPAYLNLQINNYEISGYGNSLELSMQNNNGKTICHGYNNQIKADGKVRMGPCQPGSYKVCLSIKSGRRPKIIDKIPVSLVSGDNEISINIPPLYKLTVSFPEFKAGTKIRLNNSENRFNSYKNLNENLKAVFDELPVGTYTLYVNKKTMKVTIPDQTEVVFQSETPAKK